MKNLVIEDYKILNEDFIDWIRKNHVRGRGFGQDHHSVEGTPVYSVYKLHKRNWIQHDGYTFQAVSINHDSNEVYLHFEYKEALEFARLDGWGKGFSL